MANMTVITKPAPVPSSAPSPVLDQLQNVISIGGMFKNERYKLSQEFEKAREQWVLDLTAEAAKGFNLQSVVNRVRDLDAKEKVFNEQTASLDRVISQLEIILKSYETDKTKKAQLIQAIDARMTSVGQACQEYDDLKTWRNHLLRKTKPALRPKNVGKP